MIRVFLCYAPLAWLGGLLFDIPGLFIGAVTGNAIAAFIAWSMLKSVYKNLEHDSTFKTTEKAQDLATEKMENNVIEAGQLDAS